MTLKMTDSWYNNEDWREIDRVVQYFLQVKLLTDDWYKSVLHTALNPPEKDICAPKECKKKIPESKSLILTTVISTHMLCDPHQNTFYLEWKESQNNILKSRI